MLLGENINGEDKIGNNVKEKGRKEERKREKIEVEG
jgi:hypothetical protein